MTCPNPELLSAFFDGEVEPPWSERIREHVDECDHCRTRLARLESLKRLLHSDREPSMEDSLQRSRQRLKRELPVHAFRGVRFWRARVSVPLPAIAATLLLFVGMSAVLIFFSTRPNFPFMSIRRQPSGVTEVQVAAPIEDLEQLLRSLDQELVNQQIVITLPEDTEFLQIGEPRMLRAEDFGRRLR